MELKSHENAHAFTLAEVLIVLAIIGVVAALTIPTLIQNYKKHVVVTKLQKAYSTLQNAFELAKVEHGDYETWKWNQFDTQQESVQYFYEKYIFPHLKVSKKCFPAVSGDCFATDLKYLDGNQESILEKHGAFVMSDGTAVMSWAGNIQTDYPHIQIYLDINGKNKPNVFGKDIFSLIFSPKTSENAYYYNEDDDTVRFGYRFPRNLVFWGEGFDVQQIESQKIDVSLGASNNIFKMSCSDNISLSAQSKNVPGRVCGALIKANGWKIPDGYPKL